jgi:hypothetical protein
LNGYIFKYKLDYSLSFTKCSRRKLERIQMNEEIIQLIYPWDQQQHNEGCMNPWCRHQHDEDWLEFMLEEDRVDAERCPLGAECPEPENCHFFHPMWEIQFNHPQTLARYLSLPYVQKKKMDIECQYLTARLRQIDLEPSVTSHLVSIVPQVFRLYGGDILAVTQAVVVAVVAVAGQSISNVSISGAREAVRTAVGDAKAVQMEEVLTGICAVLEPELLALPPQLGFSDKMKTAMKIGASSLSGGGTVEASVAAGLAGVH